MICLIRVGVDDTGHGVAILAIDARLSRSGIDVGHAVFAIEADVAFGAVDAIDTVFTGNGDTIFAVSTFDGNTVRTVDNDGRAVFTVDANRTVHTIFAVSAFRTDREIVSKFEVIRRLAVNSGCFKLQVVACIVSRTGFCSAFDGNLRVFFSDVLNGLQLTAVNGISRGRAYITVCNVSNLAFACIDTTGSY